MESRISLHHLSLPFLYQTSTILRPPLQRSRCILQASRALSTSHGLLPKAPWSGRGYQGKRRRRTPQEREHDRLVAEGLQSSDEPATPPEQMLLSGRAGANNNLSFLKQKTEGSERAFQRLDRSPRESSTITPKERKVFDRIFDDIAKGINPKKKLSEAEAQALRSSVYKADTGEATKDRPKQSPEARAEHDDLLSVFTKALHRPTESRSSPRDEPLGTSNQHRYPPALREVSKRTEEFVSQLWAQRNEREERHPEALQGEILSKDINENKNPDLNQEEDVHIGEFMGAYSEMAEQTVKKAFGKIERAFATAVQSEEGDLAIWRVCEKMVFPMIAQLGIQANDTEAGEGLIQEKPIAKADVRRERKHLKRRIGKIMRQARKSGEAPGTEEQMREEIEQLAVSPIKIPEHIAAMTLFSTLYPASLLLALRLLNTHFPASPLPHLLLPTIKSLGPTSYVLGATTQFYNELLSIQWNRYADMKSMSELLAEMERERVDFDSGTMLVLRKVLDSRKAEGTMSVGKKLWWGLESTRTYFGILCGTREGWLRLIRERLEERAQEVGEPSVSKSEVAEGEIKESLDGRDVEKQEVVWI